MHKETPITINITKEVEVGTKSIESDLESIYDKVNMIMRGIQPEANQEADLQPYVDRFSIAMNKIEAYEANSKSRRKLRSSLATLINPLKWLGEDPLLEQPGMDETKINDALDRLETALITYGASLEKVGGATSTTQEVEPKKETINIALERTTALKSFATTYSTLDARVRNLREKVKPALLGLIFDLGQELSFLQRKNDDGALSTTDIALKLSKLEKEIAELEKEPQEEETARCRRTYNCEPSITSVHTRRTKRKYLTQSTFSRDWHQ